MSDKKVQFFTLIGLTLFFTPPLYAKKIHLSDIDIPPQLVPELYQQHWHSGPTGAVSGSITSPNAFGNLQNAIFFGVSTIPTQHYLDSSINASTATLFGLSFGRADKILGLTLGITDTSLFNHFHFMQQATLSLRVNHYFNSTTSIAFGAVNLVGTKQFATLPNSFYFVLTHTFRTAIPITGSLGYGNGIFNPVNHPTSKHNQQLYPFISLGFGLTPELAFITDWTSNRLSIGTSYTPRLIPHWPIAFNINLLNVTGSLPEYEHHGNLCISLLVWHAMS